MSNLLANQSPQKNKQRAVFLRNIGHRDIGHNFRLFNNSEGFSET